MEKKMYVIQLYSDILEWRLGCPLLTGFMRTRHKDLKCTKTGWLVFSLFVVGGFEGVRVAATSRVGLQESMLARLEGPEVLSAESLAATPRTKTARSHRQRGPQ